MVYNPELCQPIERINAILIAHLTPEQLDTIHEKFSRGAWMLTPYPCQRLFIQKRLDLTSSSHGDMRRAYPGAEPLIVIDARTPADGSIWYLDDFATEEDVEDDLAENTNTLLKLRMGLEDIVISKVNYDIANTDIREEMDHANVPSPAPEEFDQDEVYHCGLDCITDRFIQTTAYITATPDEMEEKTNGGEILYRLKPDIARREGLESEWTEGRDAENKEVGDGTTIKFPAGSKTIHCKYDVNTVIQRYEKLDGSL